MERSLKAALIDFLIRGKIPPLDGIGFGFGVAHPKPPLVTRCIQAFCPCLGERCTCYFRLLCVLREHNKHAAPLPECILIDIEFVLAASPMAVTVPTPGTRALITAGVSSPPEAPMVPPTTPPIAAPMPGCSVSVVGTC